MIREGDHIQQLAEYIKKNISKGYTTESLKFSLMNQGYSRISVEKAIELANEQLAEKAPVMKEKPLITYKVYDEGEPIKEGFLKKLFKFFK
jgi:hypothetical protein